MRESDRQLKWLQVEDRDYNDKRRRHDDLLKAHDQWVALLKESIDPHEASLLLSKQVSFYQMIDDLKASCNSRCRLDMHGEWDRNWAKTEQVFPIDLVLWSDLRDRYFLIHEGNPTDLEARLSEIFKRRFLSVVPWDEHSREYGPLALTLQAEKMNGENSMSSGMLLENIEGIERARAYDSGRIAKSTKRKAVTANQVGTRGNTTSGFKPCSRHPNGKHTDEVCYDINPPKSKGGKTANKRQRTVKFDGMDKHGRQQAVVKKGALKKNSTNATGDRLAFLEHKFDALIAKTSQTEVQFAKPVQILKAEVQRKLFYLNNLTDFDLTSNPVILDFGASRHVAPIKLDLTDLQEVKESIVMIDAINNTTPIQYTGSLLMNTAGKSVLFNDVLVCDKVANLLISCNAWLENTEHKIILDGTHAYLQYAHSSDLHEIARVVQGTYYMNPLKTLGDHKYDLKAVVNALQAGKSSPYRIYSKVGLCPRSIIIDGKDVGELSNPAFLTNT